MRYLMLSDIHANLEALRSALDVVQVDAGKDYDEVVCLGDVVGYGPDPNECIETLLSLGPVAVVRGNHDKACSGITDAEDFNSTARKAAEWTLEALKKDNLKYLRELPRGPQAVGEFRIVHGSPRDEDEYLFTAEGAAESFVAHPHPLTFFGHTHVQGGFVLDRDSAVEEIVPGHEEQGDKVSRIDFALEEGKRYLINPGSVGQPRDGDPRAAYAFYDSDRKVVEFRRVPYPIEGTQKKILAAGLPASLSVRLAIGH